VREGSPKSPPSGVMSHQVRLPELQVMYVESFTGLAGAADAFDRLQARVPSLKGRKFYRSEKEVVLFLPLLG